MIDVSTTEDAAARVGADALVVGVYEGDDEFSLTEIASQVDEVMGGAISDQLRALHFEGKPGKVRIVGSGGVIEATVVVAVGLGVPDAVDADVVRRASAAAMRAAAKLSSVATTLVGVLDDVEAATAAVVEGALLAAYRFLDYKSDPEPSRVERLVVVAGDSPAAERGLSAARATYRTRDLTNTPARDMRPRVLAAFAEDAAESGRLEIEVWDEERIAAERLGGLLAVAAGSAESPRLIKLTYTPDSNPTGTLALVGKGITFDSGGLSLKTAENMEKQKTDMSGAAAVIGAMSVLDELRPTVKVIAFVPATENMPGAGATKPGDVFTARNGKTVEVLNTDAEGRLVLADGLSLAAEESPDAIIDVATLTGACVTALGTKYAGLFANNDALGTDVLEAAARSGEPIWRLPLAEQYRKQIDSDVADVRNIAGRAGGAITAALFLREFAGDVPWAHIDIAGPARSDSVDDYIPKGGTGFGTRTLIEVIRDFTPPVAG